MLILVDTKEKWRNQRVASSNITHPRVGVALINIINKEEIIDIIIVLWAG